MLRIYFIRHGEVKHSGESGCVDKMIFFSGPEAELSDKGRAQAERVGRRLMECGIERVYTSPLKRAVQTAQGISGIIGVEVETDQLLKEFDFGQWHDKDMQSIQNEYPKEFDIWCSSPERFKAPSGEVFVEFKKRVERMLEVIVDAHIAEEEDGNRELKNVVVVTHGGFIRTVLAILMEVSIKVTWQFAIDNCGVTLVAVTNNRENYIQCVNDTELAGLVGSSSTTVGR